MTTRVPLTAVVMTYNEELNIGRCLESVEGWADEVFVVDSFSTDATLGIARRYTCEIVQHVYEGHPQQWTWALASLPFKHSWILALDADFVVTPELREAIRDVIARDAAGCDGYYVRHREIFRHRFIRHGSIYPRYWLRLFRREKVFLDPENLVDVHFYISGPVGRLEYDVIEENAKEHDFAFWIEKQMRFAKRQAVEELRRRSGEARAPMPPRLFGTPDQRTLWLKQRWYRMPLYSRSVFYFLYRYVVRLGFLDGKAGFLYHFSQGFFNLLLIDVFIDELRAKKETGRRKRTEEDGESSAGGSRE